MKRTSLLIITAGVLGFACLARSEMVVRAMPFRRGGPPAPPSYKTGLLSVWNLDDNSANTTVDDSGVNNFDATAAANTSTKNVAGKIGTALDFNGVNDVVTVGDKYRFAAGTNWTVNIWVYPKDTTAGGCPIGKDAASNRSYFYWMGAQPANWALNFYHFNSAGSAEEWHAGWGGLPAAAWTMVTFSLQDDGTRRFRTWTNAVSVIDATPSFSTGDKAANLTIGHIDSTPTSNWWTGRVDQVSVWQRCLTPLEVTNLYNGGSGVTLP